VSTLLLVEDHSDTRLMYAEYLADRYEIIEASDAEGALETMRSRAPDLVVTDLSLPRMDGFELVLHMRQDAALSLVPVICLSGYSSDVLEKRAREVKCDRVLQKPCLPEALATVVGELLRERKERRPT
jgi:CheY-like chemotaxis protein